MPQIWLDYEELGEWLECDVAAARRQVIAHGWTRRKCRDGFSRAKLPPSLADEYMIEHVVTRTSEIETPASELKALLRDQIRRASAGQPSASLFCESRIAADGLGRGPSELGRAR